MVFFMCGIGNDPPEELRDTIQHLPSAEILLTRKSHTSSCITDSSSSSSSQSIAESKNTSSLPLTVLDFLTFSCLSFWARSKHRALKRSRKSDDCVSSGVLPLACVNNGWQRMIGVLEELVSRVLYWARLLACAATTGDDLGEARGDETSGW